MCTWMGGRAGGHELTTELCCKWVSLEVQVVSEFKRDR